MSIGVAIIGSGIFVTEQHLVDLNSKLPLFFLANPTYNTARRQSKLKPHPQSHLLTQPQIRHSTQCRRRPLL